MLKRHDITTKANTLRIILTKNEDPGEKTIKQAIGIAFDLLTDALQKLTVVAEDAQARNDERARVHKQAAELNAARVAARQTT